MRRRFTTLRAFSLLFTLHTLLFTISCGDESKCDGKAGGFPALKIINSSGCDLNVMVDLGRLTYVPAKGTVCQTNLADTPLSGNHTIQAAKTTTGEICETRSVDFGALPEDATAQGRLVTYQPSLANCVCDAKTG